MTCAKTGKTLSTIRLCPSLATLGAMCPSSGGGRTPYLGGQMNVEKIAHRWVLVKAHTKVIFRTIKQLRRTGIVLQNQ